MYNKIHYYFGYGKGKTSAAVGAAVRMAGSGAKVLFCQFLKNGTSSEINILNTLDNVECLFCDNPMGFVWNMNRDEKKSATLCTAQLLEKRIEYAKSVHMIVFDELTDAVDCGFLDKGYVIKAIKMLSQSTEIVITGHIKDADFINISDYVSEVKNIKHPYEKGTQARKGIEY